jgi:hypothetical protein
MKVDQVGRHFLNLYQMCLKQKQIIFQVMLEQNIIVKNVAVTMDISLMMGHNLQAKDIVIMVYAWFLKEKFK